MNFMVRFGLRQMSKKDIFQLGWAMDVNCWPSTGLTLTCWVFLSVCECVCDGMWVCVCARLISDRWCWFKMQTKWRTHKPCFVDYVGEYMDNVVVDSAMRLWIVFKKAANVWRRFIYEWALRIWRSIKTPANPAHTQTDAHVRYACKTVTIKDKIQVMYKVLELAHENEFSSV